MTRQVIVGVGLAGTGVAVALVLRPKALVLFSEACERMLDQMPDDFPPKRMMGNVEQLRESNARILELLDKEAPVPGRPASVSTPSAPIPTG